jgi:LAO/AO transport system kinase
VLTSAYTKKGIDDLWVSLSDYREVMQQSNEFERKRQLQLKSWFWTHLKENLIDKILGIEDLKNELEMLEEKVVKGTITPGLAAECIIEKFFSKTSKNS